MQTMTASSTACSKSVLEILRRFLCLLVFLPTLAWTAEIGIREPRVVLSDEGYSLSADFEFELNSRLEEAVNRGVVLYFETEFELGRERWYWFDEKLISRSQTHRLSYHALTRQYRLSTGGLHQSFDTLSEALRMLRRLRNWLIIERGEITLDSGKYQAALRLRLDVTQLPRPFQISALGNKDWSLAADWKIWSLKLPLPDPVGEK
jgi:hypothetical protein